MNLRRTSRRAAIGLTAALALALAGPVGQATAGHLDEPPGVPVDDPIPGHIEDGAIQLELETVAEGGGLTAPNWGTSAPGHDELFVVDQDGPLWEVDLGTGAAREVLNTAGLLVPLILDADERGFLGVAFHPDFATNGLLYTMTSEPIDPANPPSPATQPNHDATVREWRVPDPQADGFVVDPASSRVVLEIREPQFNHNGGALFFGRTDADRNLLYLTSGDGGCADDQNGQLGLAGEGPCISHEGDGNAQNLGNLLGKILRIDPLGRADGAYSAAGAGIPGAEREIFAFGFRNPFRASADRATGEIWTADVGQNQLEEIDGPIVPGGNYGWRFTEGTFAFDPAGFELFGFASDGFIHTGPVDPDAPDGLIDPVAQYDHDEGVAAIGGFVYRGSLLPAALRGKYVLGEYSDGLNSGNGRVLYVDEADRADPHDRTPKVFNLVDGHLDVFVLGIGEDANGELYVLANRTGGPSEETGLVLKLVRACADDADCRD